MTKIESLWQKVREEIHQSPIGDNEFKLIRLDPDSPHNLTAGIDGMGNLMLAAEINSRPPDIDVGTRALEYFRHQRSGGNWLMVLRLIGEGLDQVFGRLCQDLIDEAVHAPSQAALIKLFQRRLLLWKKLFQQGGNGCLEKYQIQGLMAELLALESLLARENSSVMDTVMAWTGPLKKDQDFIFSDHSIEIKAISPKVDKVGISSVSQLYSDGSLELWIYLLREAASDGDTALGIMDLIARLENRLALNCPDALPVFRGLLLEAGYVEQECYESSCFNILGLEKYRVSEGFPRLIPDDIPQGISDISYSISLAELDPFKISLE